MRVAIVGAGMSGLAAGRLLKSSGHDVVIYEKAACVGGRVATQTVGPYIFDSGATSIAPRGMSIEHAMLEELDTADLVRIVKPIYTHYALRVSGGDVAKAKVPRYAYANGNNTLARLLAANLEVRLNSQVEEIDKHHNQYAIGDERYEALILTPPIPQTSALLWSLGESRPVANSSYRACITVLLGFDHELPPQHYHALLDADQQHPLTWLCIETEKCAGRAPHGHTAMVAQLNGPYSMSHFSAPDNDAVSLVLGFLSRLYGPGWDAPVAAAVKRWRYSQPEGLAYFDSVNRPGSTLLIAGDGLVGGRTEQAFESGVRVAKLLIAR